MNWNQSNNNLFMQRISFRLILHSGFIQLFKSLFCFWRWENYSLKWQHFCDCLATLPCILTSKRPRLSYEHYRYSISLLQNVHNWGSISHCEVRFNVPLCLLYSWTVGKINQLNVSSLSSNSFSLGTNEQCACCNVFVISH